MALESTALELVEEWKRKCCEFSTQSDDVLIPVIAKVFDAMIVILKKLDNSRIQLALKLLESKRSMCLSAETSEDPSIRTLMYGVIQSVHDILLDVTGSNDLNSTKEKTALVIVEEWKRKCCELSIQSEDILISVIAELFDTIALILMGSDHSRIQLALSSLKSERSMCLASETTDELSIRALIYGVIQCVHGTLLDLTTLNESIRLHNEAQNDEVLNFTPSSLIEPKEELKDIKDEEMMDDFVIPNYYEFPVNPKEESVNQMRDSLHDNEMQDGFDPIMGEENNNITSDMNEINGTVESESSSEKIDMETRKRPSRSVSNRKNYVESEQDSDEDARSSMKKMKSNSEQRDVNGKKSNNRKVSKSKSTVKNYRFVNRNTRRNDTELECLECEYRTMSVSAWVQHLNKSHSKTPSQAGLILRCECGNESISAKHSRTCKISKTTVVRKEDGTTKKSQAS